MPDTCTDIIQTEAAREKTRFSWNNHSIQKSILKILIFNCSVRNHVRYDFYLSWLRYLRPPRHQWRSIFKCMVTHKCTCVCAQACTPARSEVMYSFCVLQGRTAFMDHCTGTRVFMVHFLVEFRKWTWTDGCIYMPQDSRAVQMAAKASSSMTTEASLHETKFLNSSSEDGKRVSSLSWKLQVVRVYMAQGINYY